MLLRELTNKITVNKVVEFDLGGAIDKMFGTEKPALRPGFVNRRPAGGRARKNWDARHGASHNADGSPKFQDPSTMMPQTGSPATNTTVPTTNAPQVQDPTTMIPQVNPPVAQDPTQMLPQIPNSVKPGSEMAIAKELSKPGWQNNLADTLGKHTVLGGAQAQGLISKVSQYALPAAGVLALLYGGKKLIDFITRKKKRQENIQEGGYINNTKDAIETLGRLRGKGKQLERGQQEYEGNLPNEYVNDVWDVYTWMESKLGGSPEATDPKLKSIMTDVLALRGEAKKMERIYKPDLQQSDEHMGAATFGNMVVNTLYPLMQWLDMNEKKFESIANEAATAGATSAGNIASVANPKQAYGHRKRDKNGIPKAPQKKNPDGTAKSALDISDNLMGGKTIKR